MSEENEAVIRRLHEALNNKDIKGFEDAYDPNVTYHGTGDLAEADRGAFVQFIGAMLEAFPDANATMDDLFSSGDKVAYRITIKGTHKAELMGIPATNKAITIRSIGIARVSGGKIVEEWENYDEMGMMQQLGVVPSPGQG